MRYSYLFTISICLLFLEGCHSKVQTTSGSLESDTTRNQMNDVKIMIAQKTTFYNEIVSNGRIYALKKADLVFKANDPIKKIYYKNGDFVKQGEIIAMLENSELNIRLAQSKAQFQRARLDLIDALIGKGYEFKDSAKIPKNIMETSMLRSGYTQAKTALEMADFEYNASILTAPMSGIIVNMFSKELNRPLQTALNPQFCTIIDNSAFQIEFPILETEISRVKKGQKIEVSPFFDTTIKIEGEVTVVNPVVEENGMVRVYAEVRNSQNILCQGMNVKTFIKQKVENQLVVPKRAVTIRSDKDVIFTLSGGLAKWNYATLGGENSKYYIVTEGISVGDTIIIEGNAHLANLSRVRVNELSSIN